MENSIYVVFEVFCDYHSSADPIVWFLNEKEAVKFAEKMEERNKNFKYEVEKVEYGGSYFSEIIDYAYSIYEDFDEEEIKTQPTSIRKLWEKVDRLENKVEKYSV